MKNNNRIIWKPKFSELLIYSAILAAIWLVISFILTVNYCNNHKDGLCFLQILGYPFFPGFFIYSIFESFFRIDLIFNILGEGFSEGIVELIVTALSLTVCFTLAYLIIFIKNNRDKLKPNLISLTFFIIFLLLSIPLVTNCDSDFSDRVKDEDFCPVSGFSSYNSECVLCEYKIFNFEIAKFARVGGYEFPEMQNVFFTFFIVLGYLFISSFTFYYKLWPKKKRRYSLIILALSLLIIYNLSILSATDHPPDYKCSLEENPENQYSCYLEYFDCNQGIYACDSLPQDTKFQIDKKTNCYAIMASLRYNPNSCNYIGDDSFIDSCLELSNKWLNSLDNEVFSELTDQLQRFPCGFDKSIDTVCQVPENKVNSINKEDLYFYCSTRCEPNLVASCFSKALAEKYKNNPSQSMVTEYCNFIASKDPWGANCQWHFDQEIKS